MNIVGGSENFYQEYSSNLQMIENALESLKEETVGQEGKLIWSNKSFRFEYCVFKNPFHQMIESFINARMTSQALYNISSKLNVCIYNNLSGITKLSPDELIEIEEKLLRIKDLVIPASKCILALEQVFGTQGKCQSLIARIHKKWLPRFMISFL